VTAIPLGRLLQAASSNQPGHLEWKYPCGLGFPIRWMPLFDLAPGEVCHAADVAIRAVRSYRTLSPLPSAEAYGGLLSVALSLGSPPAAVSRHRISMEPGLSSHAET
jgi:hypothetical protein